MKVFLILMMASLLFCTCRDKQNISTPSNIMVIPAAKMLSGELAENSRISKIKIFLADSLASTYINALFKDMEAFSKVSAEQESNVVFSNDTTMAEEAYKLDIAATKIQVTYSSEAGRQYALVTLHQIATFNGFPLPKVTVEDSPKFSYRGMHLDVARHFFSVADVKKYLDYMAYYKFNYFHWHLTEDQGWRIEIKKYPKLQEIAAYRDETLVGHYNDQPHQFDGKKYGGYYTHEDIKEVVAYATARNIQVIPEIEMPGHAQAAIAAYPELGCGNKDVKVATKWGVFEEVYCPNEVTFKFLEDVIDEVISLFPGKYIHIGGDECPKKAWESNAFCQKIIKEQGIETGEHGLQSYFISRMEKYINARGKQIIGWDEILEGGLAPNATVMSWRGIEGGLEAARQNHDVVMTPGSHCYFDHYQSESPTEPLAIGGLTNVEKVYHWEPIPDSLEADKRKYILGGQANVWTEYILDFGQVEYMAFARGIAMSEALWSQDKNYQKFLVRYEKHTDYWQKNGTNMAFHVYDLSPQIHAGNGKGVAVNFDPIEGAIIDYTLNGGENTRLNANNSLPITTPGKYIFTALKGDKKSQPLAVEFDLHEATTASISLENQPSSRYAGNGPSSIINGVKGSDEKYGGSEWLGFDGTDAVGLLEFDKAKSLKEITFRFFKGEGQWIYLPKKVEVLSSDDGRVFERMNVTNDITTDTKVATINIPLQNKEIKYLKFVANNYGLIPEGSQGAGHKAWLFVDEVVIR